MSDLFLNTRRTGDGLSIEWQVSGVLPADIARQLPFARSLALNRTAVESVAAVRTGAQQRFHVRGNTGRQFFEQSFQVTQYSTKQSPAIEFGMSRALLQGRSTFLADFEDGATRTAEGRNKFPFLPAIGSSVRRTINDTVPPWLYPKALGLLDNFNGGGRDRTPARRGSKRGLRARENRKAFILRREDGSPIGIFRRIPLGSESSAGGVSGRSRGAFRRASSTLELLFATPKVVRIAPRFPFHQLAERAMLDGIQANFEGMLAYATDQARQDRNAAFAAAFADQLPGARGRRR